MDLKGFFGNWIVKNILLAIITVVVLVLGASLLLNVLTRHNQEIRVPDFTNMSISEAGTVANAHGVRIDVADSVYIKRMERGTVFRQLPAAGSHVKKGRRIELTINAVLPKQITMPNVVGYSMRQAKAELSSRGLVLGKLIYVEDIATNNVLKQLCGNREIKPGTPIESESVIDLVVGLNRLDDKTYVPMLHGVRYLSAIDALHNNSLNLRKAVFDKTVKDYNDSLNAFVFRQVPDTSSAPRMMGSEVELYFTLDRNRIPRAEVPEKTDSHNERQ